MASDDKNWERDLIMDMAQQYMKDKKRTRFWSILFRTIFVLMFLLSVVITVGTFAPKDHLRDKPHTALVDIQGGIFSTGRASADKIVTSLREAYKDKGTRGIILRINSPGGSPVQANFVFNEVKRLRKQHPDIPVYAVCTDMCASAAYYIAASADKVYSDPSSLVGSIGVIYNGFGFVDTLHKLGVERRLVTAGTNKGFMDPFSPVNSTQQQQLSDMLQTVHKEFIDSVKQGRGKRLKSNPDIFSGLFWTGRQAKDYGLVDDFGSPGYVAREVIKQEKVYNYSDTSNVFEKMMKKFGAGVSDELMTHLMIGSSPLS